MWEEIVEVGNLGFKHNVSVKVQQNRRISVKMHIGATKNMKAKRDIEHSLVSTWTHSWSKYSNVNAGLSLLDNWGLAWTYQVRLCPNSGRTTVRGTASMSWFTAKCLCKMRNKCKFLQKLIANCYEDKRVVKLTRI
jgi:hypothetical protein